MHSSALRHCAVALLAWLFLAAPCSAAIHKTNWTCWMHDDGTTAACTPHGAMDTAARARSIGFDASPKSLLEPAGMRRAPASKQRVFVPMHTIPFDDESAAELVRAVLCAQRQECSASYHSDPAKFAAMDPELFADMHDPVLAD